MKIAITENMSVASKIYKNASCSRIYPSKPWRYSTTRKIDRTIIKKLARYNVIICLRHERVRACWVGTFCILISKSIATTTKRPKKRSWTKRPPTIMFDPVFKEEAVPLDCKPPPAKWISDYSYHGKITRDLPPPCITKDKTSPQTKILVSHFFLIRACASPSTSKIIRPSSM